LPAIPLSNEVLRESAAAYLSCGSQVAAARSLNISRATLQHRLEEANRRNILEKAPPEAPHRIYFDVSDGIVAVASDAHYWPGIRSTAHRAFVKFCGEFPNIKAVVMNGDVHDGAQTSRHAPIGWETRPSVIQEIEAGQERLGEIESALSKQSGKVRKIWTLGNHDARFETRLATVAPEYARVHGVHLKDHFPTWDTAWSAWVNDDVVIKHRYKGGIHATHNNAVNSGKTMVTGHLHSLKVTPFTDYNGDRWGVDTGTLAQVGGPQFLDYMEDGPANWRAGFAVLTFWKGRLLWPELVHVIDEEAGLVSFQGRVWSV
jgi:hypothetical protein